MQPVRTFSDVQTAFCTHGTHYRAEPGGHVLQCCVRIDRHGVRGMVVPCVQPINASSTR